MTHTTTVDVTDVKYVKNAVLPSKYMLDLDGLGTVSVSEGDSDAYEGIDAAVENDELDAVTVKVYSSDLSPESRCEVLEVA